MLTVHGARTHNLKNLTLAIPLGSWVVVTGVSGSGKSSLAFDTLLAEGQRRFWDAMPIAARQRLPKLERAAVDAIDHLPPALGVGQQFGVPSWGATVGSSAGLLRPLQELFAHHAELWCPDCDRRVEPATPATVASEIGRLPAGTPVTLGYRLAPLTPREWKAALARLQQAGMVRLEVEGRLHRLGEDEVPFPGEKGATVLVDRFAAGGVDPGRLWEGLELAFEQADDAVALQVDGIWQWRLRQRRCEACGQAFADPVPGTFRFEGDAPPCPRCVGGEGSRPVDCTLCMGTRLGVAMLGYRLGGATFADMAVRPLSWVASWAMELRKGLPAGLGATAEELLRRLEFLQEVGLGYLAAGRGVETLSTGERRRLSLTNVMSSRLAHALFLLDEPTAGLHPVDVGRLVAAMKRLQRLGNTVVVVEHDLDVVRAADLVIELGPGGGQGGGALVFRGTPGELAEDAKSATAAFLGRRRAVARIPRKPAGWLRLRGARTHNLQAIDVEFPLGCLCCVAGVSGSGKSSLVIDTLLPALAARAGATGAPVPACEGLEGGTAWRQAVRVDAGTIARTPRGNAATYLKIFDEIRAAFAETFEARTRGISARDFSFNLAGGRCERCEGLGQLTVDLQLLPAVPIPCPECGGRRYQDRILEVKLRGRNIAEVLDLTAQEAFGFFRGMPRIQDRLHGLSEVGLDYLRLGQPLATLSGGEAQRLRLAVALGARTAARTLFVLEEPSLGLHPLDIVRLRGSFDALLAVGHSLIVVEHDLEVLWAADWIIELGPGAGPEGGRVIAAGTPAELAKLETPTGRALAPLFA